MNTLILGQRKMGKSTLALAHAALAHKTIIVFDPNANYRSPAFDRVPLEGLEAWMEVDDGQIKVAVVGPFDQADIHPAFDAASEVLWRWDDFSLIVDESMLLQNPARMNDGLNRFWRRSTVDQTIIQTGHRLYEMHQVTRMMTDEFLVFRTELPRERKLIGEVYSPELEAQVYELEDREYIHWYRTNNGTEHYRQPDSTAWYVDLRNPNRRHARGTEIDREHKAVKQAAGAIREGADISSDPADGPSTLADPAAAG